MNTAVITIETSPIVLNGTAPVTTGKMVPTESMAEKVESAAALAAKVLPVWLSCSVPTEKEEYFCEEDAIVPNLDFIEGKVGHEPTAADVRANVVCRKHANELEERGIRCYRLRQTLQHMERMVVDAKGIEAFVGNYGKPKSTSETRPAPLTVKPFAKVSNGSGRDFDSPEARKPRGRKQHNGGHKANRDSWRTSDDS